MHMYVCMCMYMYMYMYTYMYQYMYIYMNMHMHMHIYICTCIYVCMYIHYHVCLDMYIHLRSNALRFVCRRYGIKAATFLVAALCCSAKEWFLPTWSVYEAAHADSAHRACGFFLPAPP